MKVVIMKVAVIVAVSIFILSCSDSNMEYSTIRIDLRNTISQINYSTFVDSVKSFTLNTDGLFLSGIKRLYVDDDDIFILDSGRGGIFVFSNKEKKMKCNLNYFGQGDREFVDIYSFTIDKMRKRIIIYTNPYIMEYTYNGDFVKKQKVDFFFRDFYALDNGDYICMLPSFIEKQPSGVWLMDSTCKKVKDLKNDVPVTEVFETVSMNYNSLDNAIYYYDRVWDDFSYITKDTVRVQYKFDVKQSVPSEERNVDTPKNLKNSVAINCFSNSGRYILLNYFTFNGSPFYWVLFDKEKKEIVISQELYNDIENTHTVSNSMFYVNDDVWCRILDFEENIADIRMEILYLKK